MLLLFSVWVHEKQKAKSEKQTNFLKTKSEKQTNFWKTKSEKRKAN